MANRVFRIELFFVAPETSVSPSPMVELSNRKLFQAPANTNTNQKCLHDSTKLQTSVTGTSAALPKQRHQAATLLREQLSRFAIVDNLAFEFSFEKIFRFEVFVSIAPGLKPVAVHQCTCLVRRGVKVAAEQLNRLLMGARSNGAAKILVQTRTEQHRWLVPENSFHSDA